jgi:hypothetical protein
VDLNHRPLGYEPNELPGCSTPHKNHISGVVEGQTFGTFTSTLFSVSRFLLSPAFSSQLAAQVVRLSTSYYFLPVQFLPLAGID